MSTLDNKAKYWHTLSGNVSIASSDTLSTGSFCDDIDIETPNTIYDDIIEAIVGRAIDQHIYEWITSAIIEGCSTFGENSPVIPRQFDHASFLELWKFIGDLMAVSWNFHSIVSRLICTAFGIRPSERTSLAKQIYGKVRSLYLFGAAISMGARMNPLSTWESPLLEAYGNYIIEQMNSALSVPLRDRMDRLYLLRHRCVTDLSQGLGDRLLSDIDCALDDMKSESNVRRYGEQLRKV